MDTNIVLPPENPDTIQKSSGAGRLVFFAVATLLVIISTVLSVIILEPVEGATEFDSLNSADEIKEGTVYRIEDMLCHGIFMYEGDAAQQGTPRKSGDGVFLEKEHVHAYHSLAMVDTNGSLTLMIFSVDRSGEEIFDRMAAHDKEENQGGDPGNSFSVSVYAKAKKLDADASEAFKSGMEKHQATPGMEKIKWMFYEMEYVCDGDEDYTALATAEKREYLKLSLGILPFALICLIFAFIKPRKSDEDTQMTEEAESFTPDSSNDSCYQ